jgi:3-oxoadipate enol-lactonase
LFAPQPGPYNRRSDLGTATYKNEADPQPRGQDFLFTVTECRIYSRHTMPTHDANGGRFHFIDQGKGTPVVLLHGFPLDGRMWEAQIPALTNAGYRVIAPDLRGFGQSHSDAPFTLESLADDVHALLAGIGALPMVLAGLSMGGYVALAYAKKYPTDLRGLVLLDTKAEADTPEGKEGRGRMIDLVRKDGAKAVADQMMPKMLAKDTVENRPETVQTLRRMMEACPPKTIEHALAAMRDRPDRSAELASIDVPAFVIVGNDDAITPRAVAEAMTKRIPRAGLVIVGGAGHMSPLEQPEPVNREIKAFLTKRVSRFRHHDSVP